MLRAGPGPGPGPGPGSGPGPRGSASSAAACLPPGTERRRLEVALRRFAVFSKVISLCPFLREREDQKDKGELCLRSPPPVLLLLLSLLLFPGPARTLSQRQKLRFLKLDHWILFISRSACLVFYNSRIYCLLRFAHPVIFFCDARFSVLCLKFLAPSFALPGPRDV